MPTRFRVGGDKCVGKLRRAFILLKCKIVAVECSNGIVMCKIRMSDRLSPSICSLLSSEVTLPSVSLFPQPEEMVTDPPQEEREKVFNNNYNN